MAVDEVLAEWASQHEGCAWRFYRWEQPTLSLGYFQRYDDRAGHAASTGCLVVRRASGGGAIMHDRELTYSLAVHARLPLARRRGDLYCIVHGTLIESLADWRLDAATYPAKAATAGAEPHGDEPFLCFQRRAAGDVVAGNVKIAGSAQRRWLESLLQHGSVLLHRSAQAPELDGIGELAGLEIDWQQLIDKWKPRLAERLGLLWYEQPLTAAERAKAERLVAEKYGNEQWTRHRGRNGSSAAPS